MKYDNNLLKIIEGKHFKTFWHCLDYLLIAGYSPIDAFGVTIKQFGEAKIFSSVAFIRMERNNQFFIQDYDHPYHTPKRPSLIIGILDDTNIHLDGLYDLYRKMLHNNKGNIIESDIEQTCEIIKTSQLTPFIIHYLLGVSEKHFGVESFVIPFDSGPTSEQQPSPNPIGRGIDANGWGRELEVAVDPNHLRDGWPLDTRPEAAIINFGDELQRRRNRLQL